MTQDQLSSPHFVQEEIGDGIIEGWRLDTSEQTLFALLKDLFENHWQSILFGTMIQGSVFEIRATAPPTRIVLLDGYLTVDFGAWHFHVCIGENYGTQVRPTSPELRAIRKTHRAELVRRLNPDGTPSSWRLRLFNGRGENQLTVFLPNPFITDDLKVAREPDWDRLAFWDQLRATYLGLPPDPKDRTAKTLFHG
ncbi:MAG: hypothetical protein RMM31_08660 [Anaerolineae bacterium]|nr:hypothetical protein [Thermoflexales bacterium]MDW8396299.1 hypothetical protein [Anaerolineae bacterium]